jgi:hypothetical protein
VTLSSSNSGVASVPATITILAGHTSGTFKVTHSAVSSQTAVILSASLNGVSASTTLTVTP